MTASADMSESPVAGPTLGAEYSATGTSPEQPTTQMAGDFGSNYVPFAKPKASSSDFSKAPFDYGKFENREALRRAMIGSGQYTAEQAATVSSLSLIHISE